MIRAGDLDRTILVMKMAEDVIDSGAVSEAWTIQTPLRAKLVQISTADVLRNAGGLTDQITIFQTHWCNGITTANRIFYADTLLAIKTIREIGRRVGLEITCEALK